MKLLSNKELIFIPILVVSMIVIMLTYLAFKGRPKTPASIEKVEIVLSNHDLTYSNETDYYEAQWENNNTLKNALIANSGDIYFCYFVFDNKDDAEKLRANNRSYIREHRFSIPNTEVSEAISNYILYTLKCEVGYTVSMRVENTVVYAYCNEENTNVIKTIMQEIGYFEK